MSSETIHKKDIILDREKLKEILDSRGLEYIELYTRVTDTYGLDISYKGFMSLLQNRVTWKLIYAYAIVTTLKLSILDIFVLVEIDVDKVRKEKREWKRKYEKNK